MLRTPATFTSLLVAQSHTDPRSLVFCGDALLVTESDLSLPSADELAVLQIAPDAFLPVGLLDGQYFQTTGLSTQDGAPPGFTFRRLRSLFGSVDESLLAVAGRAFQITEWARTHRFCGACATATVHVAGERCLRCPACGHAAYPRISPAMMVLVRKGPALLLARHKNSPTRFFTALAGFLEAGESIEDAVHREVMEEVGLKVDQLRYFGSQPWPFPHSLMVAFTAEYVSGEIVVDETEIEEAGWFGPDDPFPKVPPMGLSIAGHLIDAHRPGGNSRYSPR